MRRPPSDRERVLGCLQACAPGHHPTAKEIAFLITMELATVERELSALVRDNLVIRHHIQDGTLRYSQNAATGKRKRREHGEIAARVWACLQSAERALSVAEVRDRTGLDKVEIYPRLIHLVHRGKVIRSGEHRSARYRAATGAETERIRASLVSVDTHLDVVLDELRRIGLHHDAGQRTAAFEAIQRALRMYMPAPVPQQADERSAAPC